jgi:hypothetical protein
MYRKFTNGVEAHGGGKKRRLGLGASEQIGKEREKTQRSSVEVSVSTRKRWRDELLGLQGKGAPPTARQ